MSASIYPVHVDARLDSHLSRWLWLVKWVLVIPHYIVLAFLWVAFVVLSAVALVTIVATGRYPRGIFDFNVGVLRWSWRVAYYAYGALGTDRYPPFTLEEVPDYPAHFSVDYPEHLSRGLVLVKWWLLAIPHYLIVALLVGGGAYVAWGAVDADSDRWVWGGGIIGLLALVAAVMLLFTGRYPQQLFDLVLGLNRWVLRVAAYAGLMTDEYPPFRLDMGGDDQGAARVAVPQPPSAPAATAPTAPVATTLPAPAEATAAPPAAAPIAPAAAPAAGRPTWGPGRVTAVVIGSALFLVGGGFLIGGTALAVADQSLRNDQGFLMSPTETVTTTSYAVVTDPLTIDAGAASDVLPEEVLGDVALRARGFDGEEVFIGIAPAADVSDFLAGVEHVTLRGLTTRPLYRESPGDAAATPPADSDIWVASASGSGEQRLTWEPEAGEWAAVVMNADAGADVSADLSVGATVPALGWVVAGLFVVGGLLLVLAVGLILGAVYAGRGRR